MDAQYRSNMKVAPRVGAWIETFKFLHQRADRGRAPRGRVD